MFFFKNKSSFPFQVPSDPPVPKKPKTDDALQSPLLGDKEKQSSWLRSLSNSSSKVSFGKACQVLKAERYNTPQKTIQILPCLTELGGWNPGWPSGWI